MSTGKLDQSLDNILAARKKNAHPVRRTARRNAGQKPAAAPVGGVKKTTKPAKKAERAVATAAPTGPGRGFSKCLVSNLPSDVVETQIKDYFQQAIGPVKRVSLNYGPNGQSRGVATVFFSTNDGATKAAKQLNGVKVDNKPMRVEVIVDHTAAPAPPEAKKLADRISQPKNAANVKPKPATAAKANKGANAKKEGAKAGAEKKKGPRKAGRVKKTAEELDAEMTDYFQANTENAAPNGAAAQPAAADTAMADDI